MKGHFLSCTLSSKAKLILIIKQTHLYIQAEIKLIIYQSSIVHMKAYALNWWCNRKRSFIKSSRSLQKNHNVHQWQFLASLAHSSELRLSNPGRYPVFYISLLGLIQSASGRVIGEIAEYCNSDADSGAKLSGMYFSFKLVINASCVILGNIQNSSSLKSLIHKIETIN